MTFPELTARLRSVFAPFDLIPFLFKNAVVNARRYGNGQCFIVTVGANTDSTITHNLNRIPVGLIVLNPGTAYLPAWKVGTVAWTTTAVTVQFNAAVTSLPVYLF